MNDLKKRIREHMNVLCLDIGSKHCGSPELDKAGKYIAECFEKIGCKVIKEEFPVRGWDFSEFSFFNDFKCIWYNDSFELR